MNGRIKATFAIDDNGSDDCTFSDQGGVENRERSSRNVSENVTTVKCLPFFLSSAKSFIKSNSEIFLNK